MYINVNNIKYIQFFYITGSKFLIKIEINIYYYTYYNIKNDYKSIFNYLGNIYKIYNNI